MKKLKGSEIRRMWLDFWKSKGHDVIPSASLIPVNDPTLLWINAGVAPLKKYFDGREVPTNRRMTNAQKSIRTNDIDNVGRTARHHTFFEMLGNFSVGDYFRDEVLPWAIELLTSEKWFAFDIDKLYFTYYPDDLDTYNKWIECGVKKDHLIPIADNFWEIGEGPCGPDTEIFFDRGEKYDNNHLGIRLLKEDIENDRYIEIWNIVFSQFNSEIGVKREDYKELPSKNIDTGSGLERLACVMQEVETNYDSDLFMPIINELEKMTNIKYDGQMAYKVISDHIRSTVFALADGATFSNTGRGYVLRRILRRAVRYGKVLKLNEAFLYKLVPSCIAIMQEFYPYLLEKEELVTSQIKVEEEKFLQTLENGEKKLNDYMDNSKTKVIDGNICFLLYDTFGFPLELTKEVALEKGFTIDEEDFKKKLAEQKERARNSRKKDQSMNVQNEDMINFKDISEFVGYDTLNVTSKVIAIFSKGAKVKQAKGDCLVVFDKTPFYGEMGGEIGDSGSINLNGVTYDVTTTIKLPNGQCASNIIMDEDYISVGDIVKCVVDERKRNSISANHSATHLLNEALREVLGSHVVQQGSYVGEDVLRFDFNNMRPLTNEEVLKVEEIVNSKIKEGLDVNIYYLDIEEAKKLGAQAQFGEKYGKIVRIVDMGYSKEFCGGCHVKCTKEIERFAILSIETKGSGIYRIEASTKDNIKKALDNTLENVFKDINITLNKINETSKELNEEIELFKTLQYTPSYQYVIDTKNYLDSLKEIAKELDKKLALLKKKENVIDINTFNNDIEIINNHKVLLKRVDNLNVDSLKDLIDAISEREKEILILFANVSNGRIVFICKNKINGLSAGKIVKMTSTICGGNGGGRDDFAQAGGKDESKIMDAFIEVKKEIARVS